MLIALAGLPATGKSTLANRLAEELQGVVLNKDVVRAVLFPPPVLDYSRQQDDITMTAIYQASARILETFPQQVVLLDGRTFLRQYQRDDLLTLANSINCPLHLIECICDDEVARQRLEAAQAQGGHPAGNRTFMLYLEVKARAEPIQTPHLVLDTGALPLEECVRQVVAHVRTSAGLVSG